MLSLWLILTSLSSRRSGNDLGDSPNEIYGEHTGSGTRFISEYLRFFAVRGIPPMLLLPEGQIGEAWETSKSIAFSENTERYVEKNIFTSSSLWMVQINIAH
jgi:hypothetical protein